MSKILEKYNCKFKGNRLDRTIIEESLEKAKEYMEKKYSKDKILSIEVLK